MSHVAVVGSDGHNWVADFPSGQRGAEILTGNGDIMGIVFSPGGDRIALTGVNHWARVFDAQTGKPLTSELPHYYLLTGASFFQNGHELLTWGMDALAQAWDIDANRPYCEPMRHEDRVAYAEVAAQSGGEVFLTTQSHPRSRSADSRTGAARLWKVLDRQNPNDRTFGVDRSFDGSKLSPDGRLLALGWSIDRKVRVLDTATGGLVCGPLPMKGGAWGLLFTPDGSRLISTTSGGEVAVWSIPGGKLVADPVLLGTAILPAEISRDGRMFATGSNDGIVRLWDSATGRPIREMRHGAVIRSLAFSPDGQLLASAGADRIARVWRTSDGSPFHELAGHQNDVMTVFFSPDGRRLVTGSLDFTARIWDTASGLSLAVLPHQGDVLDVAYSPDGRYVATASRDRTAVIWDAATGIPHSRSLLHEQAVRNVRFSPDGRRLFTLEFHGLRAWDVATGHPLTVRLAHQMQGGTAFQTSATRFDYLPDGSAVLVAEDSPRARLWHLSDPPAGAPPWFAQFLEAVAGERITAGSDRPEIVPAERFLDLAKQIQSSTSSDYYSRWARRWLAGGKPPVDPPAVDP
jgi:WD40 repeat protein